MDYKQLIDELLQELSYRVGIVDIYNKEQQSIMSEILTEWGEFEMKETIFNFLNEADEKRFKNPILNRIIKYVGKDGKEREGLVGNLLTSPKDSPGRIEAERLLPKEGTPERDAINQEIGSQGGGGQQDGQSDVTQQSDDELEQNKKKFASDPTVQKQVEKENETRKKLEDEEESSKPKTQSTTTISSNFSQKSEATEGLFAGPKEYRTIEVGGKSATVRPMIDPSNGKSLDTSNPEDRQRAIDILNERLNSLNEKAQKGINRLEEDGVPKTERTAILKWLGEVGELQAYRSFLQSDKVKDVYMLTDSEPKNDLVIIGESEERNVFLQGISVKTTKVNQQANRRGSSVKPDLESGLDTAPTRTLSIEGVDGDVDASILMNSFLELRKRLIKELSDGKVRQNPQTKESEVVLESGEVVSITEYFRRENVTEDTINKIFSDDSIFKGRFNPIRSLTDDLIEEPQISQLREHFRKEFVNMLSAGPITIDDMQEKIVDSFIKIYDDIGANITPATDMMISYYGEDGFKENRIIPKEDSEEKIMEVLEVDNFSEIDTKTQFKTILGLDWTGRGQGKKKEGKGFIDGQSFGRPSPKLYPTPRTMDDYIQNIIK